MSSNLIQKYIDGLLTEPEEMALFNELSNNDEMRLELRASLKLRETIQSNSINRVPPEAVTKSLFSTLGYSTNSIDIISSKDEKENLVYNGLKQNENTIKEKKRFGAIILLAILSSAITSLILWESYNSNFVSSRKLNNTIPVKENPNHYKNNQIVEDEKLSGSSLIDKNGNQDRINQNVEPPNILVDKNLITDKNFQSNFLNEDHKKLNVKGFGITKNRDDKLNSLSSNFKDNSSIDNKSFVIKSIKKNKNIVNNKSNNLLNQSKEIESSNEKVIEQIEINSMIPQSVLGYTSNRELTFIDKKEIVEFKKIEPLIVDENLKDKMLQSKTINKEKWMFGIRTIFEGVITGEKFERKNINTSSINNLALSAGYIINSNWKAGAEFGEESFPMLFKGKDSSVQKVNSVNFYGAFVQHSFVPISNLSFFELQNKILLGITNYGLCVKYSPTISYQPLRNLQLILGPEFTVNSFSDEPNVDFKMPGKLESKMDGPIHTPVKIGFSLGADIKF